MHLINLLSLGYSVLGFALKKKGPNIQAKSVVPKSNPIVKFIVVEGRRAIAIGIPRNEVLPISLQAAKCNLKACF